MAWVLKDYDRSLRIGERRIECGHLLKEALGGGRNEEKG